MIAAGLGDSRSPFLPLSHALARIRTRAPMPPRWNADAAALTSAAAAAAATAVPAATAARSAAGWAAVAAVAVVGAPAW